MAKALQLEGALSTVSFELDRFDPGVGDRLEVSGRWFGVRGRRFVRPTLTLFTDGGQRRALADLEHKPWAPAEGDTWQAAFPWTGDAEVVEAELAVAPDITITLPAPGGVKRKPARGRGRATKRGADGARETEPAARKPTRAREAAPAGETGSPADQAVPERPSTSEGELERLRGEIDSLRTELGAARSSREQAMSELEAARKEAAAALARRDATLADLDEANAARDAALTAREEAFEVRDQALAARKETIAGARRELHVRDEKLRGHGQAISERDHAQRALRQAAAKLDRSRQALEQAITERDEAVKSCDRLSAENAVLALAGERLALQRSNESSSRGAALVMRNATRARFDTRREADWPHRALAIVLLVCAVFALLIVAHLL